jgi:uncharacterized protein
MVEKNPQQAVIWFQKASTLGHLEATRQLAHCFLSGNGVEKNDQFAQSMLKKAALMGDAKAMVDLGQLLAPFSPEESTKWYEEAALKKDPEAMYQLGLAYRDGKGVAKNIKYAYLLFKESANFGHEGAQQAANELNSP